MLPKATPAAGIIIFLDIDSYLDVAGSLSAQEEFEFLSRIHTDVTSIVERIEFNIARTFGDGFLIYKRAPIETQLAEKAIALLQSLVSYLDTQNLTARGSLVTGEFITSENTSGNANPFPNLYGPTVNFAGKLAKTSPPNTIMCAWIAPEREATYQTLSKVKPASFPLSELPTAQVLALHPDAGSPQNPEAQDVVESADTDKHALEFAGQVKRFTLGMLKTADDKAKAAFAISAGLLVFLFQYEDSGFSISRPTIQLESTFSFIVEMICLGFLSLSGIFAFVTFVPRRGTKFPKGLVFFGSIARWSTAGEYVSETRKSSSAEIEDALLVHNYEIAKITSKKFVHLYICLWSLVVGILLMFGRFVLLRL